MMKIHNFHHVEMNIIQLDIMLLFTLFLSPLHSLSLIPERYLNWTQQIESDDIFIWRNLYDGKSTIQSLLLDGKEEESEWRLFKMAMMGSKGESEWRLKLLKNEKLLKEGSRQ